MKAIDVLTLVLLAVGGLNWGLVGAFQFDLVAAVFGGSDAVLARMIYLLVGISAVWQAVRIKNLVLSSTPAHAHAHA